MVLALKIPILSMITEAVFITLLEECACKLQSFHGVDCNHCPSPVS